MSSNTVVQRRLENVLSAVCWGWRGELEICQSKLKEYCMVLKYYQNRYMNSNNKLQTTSVLFVKQFFGSFFERKSMIQTLSELLNGISVLEALIQNFQHSKGLKSAHRASLRKSSPKGQFNSIVQQQGKMINENMQDLYKRLKHIFEEFFTPEEQYSPKTGQAAEPSSDSQLYDVINDYKNQNKRQKQTIKKMESEQIEMKRKWQQLEEEKLKLRQKQKQNLRLYENALSTIKQNESRLLKLTRQVEELSVEKQQLQQKLVDAAQISKVAEQLERLNASLSQKLKVCEMSEKKAIKRFETLEDIVKARIKQKDELWAKMISNKLKESSVYEKGSCQVFKQFMTSIKAANP